MDMREFTKSIKGTALLSVAVFAICQMISLLVWGFSAYITTGLLFGNLVMLLNLALFFLAGEFFVEKNLIGAGLIYVIRLLNYGVCIFISYKLAPSMVVAFGVGVLSGSVAMMMNKLKEVRRDES